MSAAAMLALLLLVAPPVSCSQPLTRLQFHSIGAGGHPAAAGGGYGGYIMDARFPHPLWTDWCEAGLYHLIIYSWFI